MKYLKSYNESKYSIPEDIKSNLLDICLELNDTGNFQIFYSHFEAPEAYRYPSKDSILIQSPSKYFRYEDIEEEIERIRDYLITEGYYIIIRFNGENSSSYSKFQLPTELFECRIFLIERKPINEAHRFRLSKDIGQNLLDICLELSDVGFCVYHVSSPSEWVKNSLIIDTTDPQDPDNFLRYFKYTEISEVVERIKDYMDQQGYDCSITLNGTNIKRKLVYDGLFECRLYFTKRKDFRVISAYDL